MLQKVRKYSTITIWYIMDIYINILYKGKDIWIRYENYSGNLKSR